MDITAELEGIDGYEARCLSAVKKWRKRFASRRITLESDPRSGRPQQSDLSESVRALIKESPLILCKCMCQKLWIAKTTCPRVMHENIEFRRCYLQWTPHSMTENEAQCRITFSEERFQVVRHARETNFNNLLTDDESRFFYEYPHNSALASSKDTLLTRASKKSESKTCLVSIIWFHNLFGLCFHQSNM
jgi:hypothetical protein